MSVSIMEALQNAQYNICKATHSFQLTIGKTQLNNAVILLEKGYPLETKVEPLLDAHGGQAENVPDHS